MQAGTVQMHQINSNYVRCEVPAAVPMLYSSQIVQ